MKKILTISLVVVLFITSFSFISNGNNTDFINVYLNSEKFSDEAILINDRTYVPVRTYSNFLGYDVGWNSEDKSVTINKKDSVENIIDKNMKSTVQIKIYDIDDNFIAIGSGFVIKKNRIVTCFHVVQNAVRIEVVTNDDKVIKVIGRIMYPDCDLALLKIKEELNPIVIKSSENITNGEDVYTISSPRGLVNSITKGVISCKERKIDNTVLIQFDASITGGSSGGLLMNKKGEAIGVIKGTVQDSQNINFAIPLNTLIDK